MPAVILLFSQITELELIPLHLIRDCLHICAKVGLESRLSKPLAQSGLTILTRYCNVLLGEGPLSESRNVSFRCGDHNSAIWAPPSQPASSGCGDRVLENLKLLLPSVTCSKVIFNYCNRVTAGGIALEEILTHRNPKCGSFEIT